MPKKKVTRRVQDMVIFLTCYFDEKICAIIKRGTLKTPKCFFTSKKNSQNVSNI
jgi:hypothetical protein